MKFSIFLAILVIAVAVSARTDEKKRVRSMYRVTDLPGRQGGVKGAHTTLRPLRKGEYICGTRICKLRPGEVPKGCEGGECQYNIGHHLRNK